MKAIKARDIPGYLLYAVTAVGAAIFYLWFRQAPAYQPVFLLRPVAWLSGVLSGISFLLSPPGLGFVGVTLSGHYIIIEKSCSGGNFFIICFTMIIFTQLQKVQGFSARLIVFTGALIGSYLCAIVASALRIVSTILLMDANLGIGWVPMHNIIGIVTYMTMICLFFLFAQKLVSILQRKGMVEKDG